MNRALLLLTLCQGFFLTNNVTFIAINGLVGLALAPSAWLATLPVTAYVAGGALFAGLVARHQRAWGRRRAFQLGLLVAIASTALCAWAALQHQFWLLVAATTLAGYYNANAGLYRFAATEIVAPEFKERAISLGAGRRHPRRRRRTEPGARHAQLLARRIRRRLCGARRGRAAARWRRSRASAFPPLRRAEHDGAGGRPLARDRRASRCSSSRPSPARSATA